MRESGTRYAILGLLASGGPATGYELRAAVVRVLSGFWNESFGQIYPELRRLADERLIEPAGRGGGEGKPYRITADGRAALLAWLMRAPAAERARSELQLKLHFGRLVGTEQARQVMEAARTAAGERLAVQRLRRQALLDGPPGEQQVFSLLALDRSLALAEADLAWAERAQRVLEALGEEGPDGALSTLHRR